MKLKELDLVKLSKITSQHVDQITCLECCKYYIAPETAVCGHTLCHNCWTGRRTCPVCAKPLERRSLRVNIPMQILSDHILTLKETYQELFHVKLDEFILDTITEIESENDPTKNVKDWLASSQNQFSAPAQSSEQSSNDIHQNSNPIEVSSSKIQIHDNTRKTKSPEKIVHVSIPQDDWDKIEPMPDTEDITKDKENVVGPMDIEPFCYEDNEYTSNKPRRSLRQKDVKDNKVVIKAKNDNSLDNGSSKDSSGDTDKRSSKTKQNWNSVKRMRKEFSKLNKKKNNKLNVSIEMCKKTQSAGKLVNLPKATPPPVYEIDENTPVFSVPEPVDAQLNNNEADKLKPISESQDYIVQETNIETPKQLPPTKTIDKHKTQVLSPKENPEDPNIANPTKMHFYKKSSLNPKQANHPKIVNHDICTNTIPSDEDIQITIRVGNSITNIYIKKKNETEVKVNTDREIQTSLTAEKYSETKSVEVENSDIQKTNINIVTNNEIHVEHQTNTKVAKQKTQNTPSLKTTSGKKNTDSADTVTAQFEITESVEKELSNIMECADNKNQQSKPSSTKGNSQNNKNIVIPNSEDLEYLNDLDIFESDSVKEANVHLLKNSNYAASEILVSTAYSKNKTQKSSNKRNRDVNEENTSSKKMKLNEAAQIINESIHRPSDLQVVDSEQINYDSVMGKVFANIDADMEEMNNENNNLKINENVEEITSEKPKDQTHNNDNGNQKESENVFSVFILDKDDDNASTLAPSIKAPILTLDNAEDFLTPVQQTSEAKPEVGNENDIELINDDSDKSVVEETPQKNTSIPKINSKKSISGIKDMDASQIASTSDKKSFANSNVKTVINLADTVEQRSNKDITVVEATKRVTLETPLTMNKFVDKIQYKSTPVARKSLNFDSCHDDNDPEQTLCPTNDQIATTTQEKEFLRKAFEKTPVSLVRSLALKTQMKSKKLCIAGSCLSTSETMKLRLLCTKYHFSYVDRFTPELTHLVVGVDDENKSQRSVKFMCALAASKWIISFEWVEKCLESNSIIEEDPFEVLDSTGEPGPMRSRLAKKKLFSNIAFYCFGPFSILDENTLKMMLEAAGGLVVREIQEINIMARKGPSILLAEPENTQEDRFIYLAMDSNIVPVNYEWVLNCLGSYSLSSIHELLLCPSSILNKNINKWPKELIAREED